VRGAIRDRWAAAGWENSWLGYPTGAEFTIRDGFAQRFQGGLIYWSASTGAQALGGSVLDVFGATGYENGFLGYPTTSVIGLPGGSFAHFQNGSIYSSAAGTHVVSGAVRTAWANQGWENGALGFPSSGQFGGLAGGGFGQHFTGGSVYSSTASGTQVVPTAVRDVWAGQGWENGALGYPVSGARAVAGGVQQDFQGGTVTVAGGHGSVALHQVARGARVSG
jgi:uncharacterized protein with LGFP repeats